MSIAKSCAEWTRQAEPTPTLEHETPASDEQTPVKTEADSGAEVSVECGGFEGRFQKKQAIEKGFAISDNKTVDGIKYFAEQGMVELDPDTGDASAEGVAKFFHEMRGLNKNAIGQFIGRSKVFNKSVLHHYTYMSKLQGLPFDQALREYLNGFRLPGKAATLTLTLNVKTRRLLLTLTL